MTRFACSHDRGQAGKGVFYSSGGGGACDPHLVPSDLVLDSKHCAADKTGNQSGHAARFRPENEYLRRGG